MKKNVRSIKQQAEYLTRQISHLESGYISIEGEREAEILYHEIYTLYFIRYIDMHKKLNELKMRRMNYDGKRTKDF